MIKLEVGQVWKMNVGGHLVRLVNTEGSNQYKYKYEYLNLTNRFANSIPKYGWCNETYLRQQCTYMKAHNSPLWKVLNN